MLWLIHTISLMERKMRVLVTGGSGYIGSHTCVQLLQSGHDVVILDNLCNSKRSVLPVIERLSGKQPTFVEGDIRNEALMTEILHDHAIETVIHFAGLKAVGESVAKPLEYYDNNVNGTLRLISAMRAANVKNFIFSSSATVYGDQPKIPYVESFPTGTPQSPYGKSKLMVEQILTDLQKPSLSGASRCCATSTRSARILQVIWAKIRRAFLTT
ncbi:SDR family NAD(P)-dependent oxidoreductase [Enterobacter hormaechei]|uniref:SDR family NAD(P)-dependent oxidoreductase n=2 Tax=Enterobacter hormaechei TaxID=158836 RepID=UPI00388F8501